MWESSGWILPTVLYAPRFAGWDDVGDTLCPIARSLSVIGDRWTMLLSRELLFGTKRFDEFQAQTGMSSHLCRPVCPAWRKKASSSAPHIRIGRFGTTIA